MRVLVINRGIRVLELSIQAQQNVILVESLLEETTEIQLPLCKVRFRLKGSKDLSIFSGDNHYRLNRIDIDFGKQNLKHPAHPFKLINNLAALLFV